MNDVMFKLQIARAIGASPWLAVLFVACLISLSRLASRPRESWLVIGAITLALFAQFGLSTIQSLLLNALGPMLLPRNVWIQHLYFSLPSSILLSGAWAMLLYAAFGRESTPRSRYLIENDVDDDEDN